MADAAIPSPHDDAAAIVLGWSLDGAPAPVGLAGLTATVGPLGYIELLGQWLGLTSTMSADCVRIGACLRALQARPEGFWRAALQTDPWAVARRVLAMHDALRLGGWDGRAEGAPPRIACLAALDLPRDGVADRLCDIIASLDALPDLQLPALTLLEPAGLWPGLWQTLFETLRLRGVRVEERPLPSVAGRGDFAIWQRFLRDGGSKAEFHGDGSLTLLTGQTETAIADAISAYLASAGADAAVIGAGGGMLGALLRARRQPRLTVAEGGDLGAQILALGLALLWEPFDAAAAIAFLGLPEHPLGDAAHLLTDAVLEMPGHGGPAWQAARYASLRARLRRDRQAGHSRRDRHRRARERLAAIAAWLPARRCDPASGMPVTTVLDLCARISAWAQTRSRPEHAAAAAMLADAATACGEPLLPRRLLERMLETIATRPIKLLPEQAAPWRYFSDPAARIDPVATTIWWVENAPATPSRLWRQEERDWINRSGLLPDENVRRARDRHGMIRAILACTDRLILIRPPETGEAEAAPAVMGLLGGCFGAALDGAWIAAETLRSGGDLAGARLVSETRTSCAPPPPRRDWQVPPGLVARRPVESASGMEKLLGCPLAWTLTYGARLRASGIAALPDINRLIGLFAHDIMRRVLEEGITTPNLAGNRAAELFEQRLAERAAPLLQPGLETMRERARIRLSRAMTILVAAIEEAGLKVAGLECVVQRAMHGAGGDSTTFTGTVDLLLRDGKGRLVVLDAKWSRSGSWYRRRLENGTAVQLAAYVWLVGTEHPATAGYFLLADARLHAADDSVFADAAVGCPSMAETWAAATDDYREALEALGRGVIVAAGVEMPETGDEAPARRLPIDPPCKFCDFSTICGKAG